MVATTTLGCLRFGRSYYEQSVRRDMVALCHGTTVIIAVVFSGGSHSYGVATKQ